MFGKLQMTPQNKILAGSFIVFLILYFTLNNRTNKKTATETIYADTLIPKGYVLVPIELANLNAVAGLINQFGVIDLYGGDTEQNSVQIATRIKILRAPLNPNQYAVLVTENLSKQIMKFKGPFWASIQNRSAEPTSVDQTSIAAHDLQILPEQRPTSSKTKSLKNIEIEYYKKEEDL
ncbi:hypothetical protein K2P97_09135 [bacterium]|nr:hypothetical protein [bacterium]